MTTPCIYRSGCPDPYACQANRSCLQLKKCAIAACPHEKVESSSYCIYHETPADRERKKAQASKQMNPIELLAWALSVDGNFDVMPAEWKRQATAIVNASLDETAVKPVAGAPYKYTQYFEHVAICDWRGYAIAEIQFGTEGMPDVHTAVGCAKKWVERLNSGAVETEVEAAHRPGTEPMSRIVGDIEWCLTQLNSSHAVAKVLKSIGERLRRLCRPEDQFTQGDAHPCDLVRAGIDPITGGALETTTESWDAIANGGPMPRGLRFDVLGWACSVCGAWCSSDAEFCAHPKGAVKARAEVCDCKDPEPALADHGLNAICEKCYRPVHGEPK